MADEFGQAPTISVPTEPLPPGTGYKPPPMDLSHLTGGGISPSIIVVGEREMQPPIIVVGEREMKPPITVIGEPRIMEPMGGVPQPEQSSVPSGATTKAVQPVFMGSDEAIGVPKPRTMETTKPTWRTIKVGTLPATPRRTRAMQPRKFGVVSSRLAKMAMTPANLGRQFKKTYG